MNSCSLLLLSLSQALTFYLSEQPTLLTDLLVVLTPRIDHARVVRMFQRKDNDNVPLIKNYLVAIQHVSRLLSKLLEPNQS